MNVARTVRVVTVEGVRALCRYRAASLVPRHSSRGVRLSGLSFVLSDDLSWLSFLLWDLRPAPGRSQTIMCQLQIPTESAINELKYEGSAAFNTEPSIPQLRSHKLSIAPSCIIHVLISRMHMKTAAVLVILSNRPAPGSTLLLAQRILTHWP